jgi:hypothetical protein
LSPLLLRFDIAVGEHNMVDTATFAVIMTKNGRDQQQTLPACFLYAQG